MQPCLLIADSDPELLDLHRRFFTNQGYRVETALSGLDCLAHLRRCRPKVLILDKELPWGGATGVLARMRDNSDVPLVPVILMSTSAFEQVEFALSPVARCVRKPIDPRQLVESVRTIEANIQEATVCDWI